MIRNSDPKTGNVTVPILVAQCWFPGLAISLLLHRVIKQVSKQEAFLGSRIATYSDGIAIYSLFRNRCNQTE